MKSIDIHNTNIDACVTDAQTAPVVVTRGGNPVALVVGLQGLDDEQVELGVSDKFWNMMESRRTEKTIDRATLEKRVGQSE